MAWFRRLLAGGLAVLLQAVPGLAEDGTSWPRVSDAGRLLVPWVVLDGYGAFGGPEQIAFSYQRQWFGSGSGLGSGFGQEVKGARLRLLWAEDMLLPQLAIGMQYRVSANPEVVRALGGRREATAYDMFGAWFVSHDLSLVLSYAELGGIARQSRQNGLHLSLQAGF